MKLHIPLPWWGEGAYTSASFIEKNELLKYWESFKFVYDTFCYWIRGFKKCGYFFLISNFSPLFGKIKILTFFKNSIFEKLVENLSTYSSYEFLQKKNTKSAINASENLRKRLSNLLRVLRGKLTLEPPHMVRATAKKAGTWWIPTLRTIKNPLKH